MSLASLLKQHFFEGGPFFMTIHYILWILVIIYSIRFFMNYYSDNKEIKKLNKFKTNILFIGGFGFLLSIFSQHLGFYGVLSSIERAQDISPTLWWFTSFFNYTAIFFLPIPGMYSFMVCF